MQLPISYYAITPLCICSTHCSCSQNYIIVHYIEINGHYDHYLFIENSLRMWNMVLQMQKLPCTHYIASYLGQLCNHKTFLSQNFHAQLQYQKPHDVEARSSLTDFFILQLVVRVLSLIGCSQTHWACLSQHSYNGAHVHLYLYTFSFLMISGRVQKIFEEVWQWVLPGLLLIIELGG